MLIGILACGVGLVQFAVPEIPMYATVIAAPDVGTNLRDDLESLASRAVAVATLVRHQTRAAIQSRYSTQATATAAT